MGSNMKFSLNALKVIGVLVVVAVAGVIVGLLVTQGLEKETVAPGPVTPTVTPSRPERPAPSPARPKPSPVEQPVPATSALATNAIPTTPATNVMTEWEDKLDDILGSEAEESEKAKQMVAMFPRLPEDGQIEVAQHLSNLVADEDYAPLGAFLTNAALPEMVLDVLLSDVLNRPNALKLPMLLEIAQNPQHSKADEAKDLLELFLEEDYGTDWATWKAKMEEWLKENPD